MRKFQAWIKRACALALMVSLALLSAGCGANKGEKSLLNPKNPVTVTVWNYYNGDQLAAFEQLVEEFNQTQGAEKGVVAVNVSQGDINTLADSLLASAQGKAGAQETPVLAAVYAETAYILNQLGALEALDPYFTKEELAAYVPGFLDEGRFGSDNQLLLFPILKSTELFTVNQTDWAPFAQATGITLESVNTKEALTAAAQRYYEWTDALTPDVLEDGKALYGRDSVANYIYVGSYQLGHELFRVENGKLTVDMDRAAFKTLWDNYYVPFINGYFGAYARFRSEDCKTGKILSLTSSSSSVGYLPTAVTLQDDTTHAIDTFIGLDLPFANAKNKAVTQQGASYCLLKATPAQREGAAVFLKWFTQPERNLAFGMMSGYSPVSLQVNARDTIAKAYAGDASTPKGKNVLEALLVSADAFGGGEAYAAKPFSGGKEARALLGDALESVAKADRAEVVRLMEAGESRQDAAAHFLTDEYFDAWFNALREKINAAVQ